MKGCHSDLHGTRGAVISLVDVTANSLTYTGVGNADGRLISPGGIKRLSPDRGLLGASMPRLHSWTLPLESEEWRLVMFSDGIMQRMTLRWELFDAWGTLDDAASALVAEWGRQTDDATMLIAAPKA